MVMFAFLQRSDGIEILFQYLYFVRSATNGTSRDLERKMIYIGIYRILLKPVLSDVLFIFHGEIFTRDLI